MKKTNLTISYGEEQIKALRWYMEQKDLKLEDELVKAVDGLLTKYVPPSVRSYISKKADAPSESPPKSRPKPAPKQAARSEEAHVQ